MDETPPRLKIETSPWAMPDAEPDRIVGTFVATEELWLFDCAAGPHLQLLRTPVDPTHRLAGTALEKAVTAWIARHHAIVGRVLTDGEVRSWAIPSPEQKDAVRARLAEEGIHVRRWIVWLAAPAGGASSTPRPPAKP